MTRYLLDSNAVTALIRGRAPFSRHVMDARRSGARIGTCEPVIAELFFGLQFSASREENTARLRRTLLGIRCWPFDRRAAEMFGVVAAELRRSGRPMQTVDIMLAAVALSLGNCVVVTTDSDLLAVPGLVVKNWELV